MKLSNYEETNVVKRNILNGGDITIGEVDVTTGILWWKRTKRVEVRRNKMGVYWFFKTTGKFTPNHQMEALARAYYD